MLHPCLHDLNLPRCDALGDSVPLARRDLGYCALARLVGSELGPHLRVHRRDLRGAVGHDWAALRYLGICYYMYLEYCAQVELFFKAPA